MVLCTCVCNRFSLIAIRIEAKDARSRWAVSALALLLLKNLHFVVTVSIGYGLNYEDLPSTIEGRLLKRNKGFESHKTWIKFMHRNLLGGNSFSQALSPQTRPASHNSPFFSPLSGGLLANDICIHYPNTITLIVSDTMQRERRLVRKCFYLLFQSILI